MQQYRELAGQELPLRKAIIDLNRKQRHLRERISVILFLVCGSPEGSEGVGRAYLGDGRRTGQNG
jgi:hypothetical protein